MFCGLLHFNRQHENFKQSVGPAMNMWFDTSSSVICTTPITHGTAGIDPLHSDGQQQLDLSLSKTFRLKERHQRQFKVNAFNTFNHPNFAAPDANVGDATEGEITSTSVDNRRLQFALRYSF